MKLFHSSPLRFTIRPAHAKWGPAMMTVLLLILGSVCMVRKIISLINKLNTHLEDRILAKCQCLECSGWICISETVRNSRTALLNVNAVQYSEIYIRGRIWKRVERTRFTNELNFRDAATNEQISIKWTKSATHSGSNSEFEAIFQGLKSTRFPIHSRR